MGKILITGATGNLGGATVKLLLEQVPAQDLVALVRDPAKAKNLQSLGLEIRRGDYFDFDSLSAAFSGIEQILFIGAPSLTDRRQQHQNVIKAVQAAAPKHVLYVSFHGSEGAQAAIAEVNDVEAETIRALAKTGVPHTILKNPLYTSAVINILGPVLKNGVRAFGPEGRLTYAALPQLARANANILLRQDNGHEGKTYVLGAGESLSFRDMAAVLTEVHGHDIVFNTVTREQWITSKVEEGWPQAQAEYIAQFVAAAAAGEFSQVTDDLEKLINQKPETFKQAYQKHLDALPVTL